MSGDFLNGGKKTEIEIPEVEYRCPHCNEVLGEDKSFCHKCGKYLGNVNSYKPVSEKKANKIRWIIGIAAVIGFLILYFVLK